MNTFTVQETTYHDIPGIVGIINITLSNGELIILRLSDHDGYIDISKTGIANDKNLIETNYWLVSPKNLCAFILSKVLDTDFMFNELQEILSQNKYQFNVDINTKTIEIIEGSEKLKINTHENDFTILHNDKKTEISFFELINLMQQDEFFNKIKDLIFHINDIYNLNNSPNICNSDNSDENTIGSNNANCKVFELCDLARMILDDQRKAASEGDNSLTRQPSTDLSSATSEPRKLNAQK